MVSTDRPHGDCPPADPTTRPARRPLHLLAALLSVLTFAVGGCGSDADRSTETETPPPAATPQTGAVASAARGKRRARHRRASELRAEVAVGAYSAAKMLKDIKLAPESSGASYRRSAFPHWLDQDGCNTRQDVLIRERRAGTPSKCAVKSGEWFSLYDGESFTNARLMDIDHFVPLEQAFVSGAGKWNLATRKAYANDLGYVGSLIAVSAASNRSKGAQDPAEWMPPRAAFQCRYVGTWVAVKFRWRLTADQAERDVLRSKVKKCGSRANVPKPQRAHIELSETG